MLHDTCGKSDEHILVLVFLERRRQYCAHCIGEWPSVESYLEDDETRANCIHDFTANEPESRIGNWHIVRLLFQLIMMAN
jgi:hypothetical protein